MKSWAWVGVLGVGALACGAKVDPADGDDTSGSSDDESSATTGMSATSPTTAATSTSTTGGGSLGCCEVHVESPGCDNAGIQACVCAVDPSCCEAPGGWDETCVEQIGALGCGVCPGGGETTSAGTTATTTGTTTSATSATDTSTTTGPDFCDPEPGDDACDGCVKDVCCDELYACFGNPDCACLMECLVSPEDLMPCLQWCAIAEPPPEALALRECQNAYCSFECG